MNVFWRTNPLSDYEADLFHALMRAHHMSAQRANISSATVVNTAVGSGNYANALAAAILTIGGKHAPLEASMRLLDSAEPLYEAESMIDCGERIPGWGNSFVKGAKDEIWLEVDEMLEATQYAEIIGDITSVLHSKKKLIYPNPSIYTAACALQLQAPACIAPYFFIYGRLVAWSHLAFEQLIAP